MKVCSISGSGAPSSEGPGVCPDTRASIVCKGGGGGQQGPGTASRDQEWRECCSAGTEFNAAAGLLVCLW